MSSTAFSQFCESLGMNKTLKDLDLRNNQITHTSATELCSAIEINTTLENLGINLKYFKCLAQNLSITLRTFTFLNFKN